MDGIHLMIRRSNTGHYGNSGSHGQYVYGRYQPSALSASIKRSRNLSLCLVFIGYLLIWIILQMHVSYYRSHYQHKLVESTNAKAVDSSSLSSSSSEKDESSKDIIDIENKQDRNNDVNIPNEIHTFEDHIDRNKYPKVSSHGAFGTYDNPNGLPSIRQIGPNSFYRLLLPVYYAKSAVINRDLRFGSYLRDKIEPYASRCVKQGEDPDGTLSVDEIPDISLDNSQTFKQHITQSNNKIKAVSLVQNLKQSGKSLCSWGPDVSPESIVTSYKSEKDKINKHVMKKASALDGEVDAFAMEPKHFPPTSEYTALLFHDICVAHNLDSTKQVQRALIIIDPANNVKERCVPCPNPLLVYGWYDHACGMMWNAQLNIQNLQDYPDCYTRNKAKIKECGQRQEPGENIKPKMAAVYSEPTLMFSFTINNPGHQVFDSMFQWIPLAFSNPKPFKRVIVHQQWNCPDSQWICALARKIGMFEDENDKSKENLIPIYPGVMTCFENVIVPRSGWSRLYTLPANAITNFRELLHKKFKFDPSSLVDKEKKLLVYAHNTKGEAKMVRRAWLNIDDLSSNDVYHIPSEDGMTKIPHSIVKIDDFAKIPMEMQAYHFFSADVIAMPHGGQFGNAIFCRPGTIIIEMSCTGYSHLAQTNHVTGFGQITGALGLYHAVVRPCKCESKEDEANFRMDATELRTIITNVRKFYQTLDPLSHYAGLGSQVYHATIDRRYCMNQ